jgi:hypothetical protein
MSTLDSARYGHRDWGALVAAQDPNDVWKLPGQAGELIGAATDEQLAAAVGVLEELGEQFFTGTGLVSRLLAGHSALLLAAVRGEQAWRASAADDGDVRIGDAAPPPEASA